MSFRSIEPGFERNTTLTFCREFVTRSVPRVYPSNGQSFDIAVSMDRTAIQTWSSCIPIPPRKKPSFVRLGFGSDHDSTRPPIVDRKLPRQVDSRKAGLSRRCDVGPVLRQFRSRVRLTSGPGSPDGCERTRWVSGDPVSCGVVADCNPRAKLRSWPARRRAT